MPSGIWNSRLGRWAAAAASALAVLAVFYRAFFLTGGDLVAGDLADTRSLIAILEHWQAVFAGRAPLASPNFFAPFRGALGFGEAMFLFAPPYAILKLAGLDRYLAFEFTLMLVKGLGFASLYALLRNPMRLSVAPALLGAALFTISSLSYVSAPHAQLVAEAFVPAAAWLVWRFHERGARWALWLAAAILGLLFSTSFYIAFLAALSMAVAGAIWMVVGEGDGGFRIMSGKRFAPWGIALAIFTAALCLFLYIYLPALARSGGRSLGETALYLRGWREALDVGPGNLVWGAVVRRVYDPLRKMTGEYGQGWPPVTALTAAFVAISSIVSLGKTGAAMRHRIVATLGLSCLALYVLTVRFGSIVPWWLVFHLVPGAQGVRVPGRIHHILGIGVAVLCACGLDSLLRGRRAARIAACALAAFLLVEQINVAPMALIGRGAEDAAFRRFAQPPPVCRTFFETNPRLPDAAGQVDAMLLARQWNIPTMNGYHGVLPENWYLVRFDDGYFSQAKNYAEQLGIADGLCEADFSDGAWKPVAATEGAPYSAGREIRFGTGGDAAAYQGLGWSYAEPGATWTIGADAALFLRMNHSPAANLRLAARLIVFTPPQHPGLHFSALVNGRRVGDWWAREGGPSLQCSAAVPAGLIHPGVTRIVIHVDDARSPAELGISFDMRKLGVALRTLKLETAP